MANVNIKMLPISPPRFKAIVKGSLEFGTEKSYNTMLTHFNKRLELCYRNDFILKDPNFFCENNFTLGAEKYEIPISTDKIYKNTLSLLNELSGFALAGELSIWATEADGKTVVYSATVKPKGDKIATMEYLKGEKARTKGNFIEAIDFYTNAIERYNRYAQAYIGRGNAFLALGKHEDAMLDFTKSLSLRVSSEAYYGIADVKKALGEFTEAIDYLELSLKNAVHFQPVFWMCRRALGENYLTLGQADKAVFQLKFVAKRQFLESDPNFDLRQKTYELFARALEKAGDKVGAGAAHLSAQNLAAQVPSESKKKLNGKLVEA
jgi:tetratricopeptide (TPR) repeat protein